MISFDSSLSDALSIGNTSAFWVLKLYYNNEASFTGVSDQDRIDGSDMYHGIVSAWGNLSHSLDFFNFTTSTGNMSVKLINTDNSISGGRFSDLFSTNNYANRKWELFLNTKNAGTYDTAARMIGTGIISGDIAYDTSFASLKLLDKSSTYHKQLPTNVVDLATYPNAPEKNTDKPIPIAYGDFYEKTDIGTIPTSYFDRYKQFYKGAFPVIIIDKWDVGDEAISAKLDSETPHTLDNENVYIYKDGYYPTLTGTISNSGSTIKFSGASAIVYVPYSSSGSSTTNVGSASTTSRDNMVDGSFSSYATLDADGSAVSPSSTQNDMALPQVNKLGEYSSINGTIKLGTVNGSYSATNRLQIGTSVNIDSGLSTNNEFQAPLAGNYSGKTDSWDFEGTVQHTLYSQANNNDLQIYESGVEIGFTIENIESHSVPELYEETVRTAVYSEFDWEIEYVDETIIRTRTKTTNYPAEIDYIYCSGKGRKYPAFIDADSRNQGYNETDLIENPVFMIEDALRTELSVTSSNIDYASFDTSGNTTNGYLGDIFNDAVGDVKFAFSQYKFINSKDFISRICKQILSWVFVGGDGKFKIRTLRRAGDYAGADKTINFNDINLKSISRTSLGAVRNDITINYNKDYGQDQFVSNVNTTDATSQGTTVNGVSQSLKLELDADILDSTTATQLADAYKTIFKDRKVILDFECLRPYYNDLEIGDIILFSNWDSNIKIYGAAMGTDYYLITSISKKPSGCSVKAIKVS